LFCGSHGPPYPQSDRVLNGQLVKFSDYCDQKETNLVREIVSACLAADLGLPIPEAFLVEIPVDWARAVPDPAVRARILASSPIAFGSRFVTGGYVAWTPSTRIQEGMVDTAAAIFVFDAISQNPDRRADKPNCLVRGEQVRIIDHELAFAHRLVIGFRPPWVPGSLKWLETKGKHIFRGDLRRRGGVDLAPIRQRWSAIDDARLAQYRSAVPAAWTHTAADLDSILELIRNARNNINACLIEIQRVLS
jgi:hypothetical protein